MRTKSLVPFFNFMQERQNVFHKRFEQRLLPPWTDDEILSKYSFCNCYRELDRVSLFVITHIARNPDALREPESLIFSSVLFRLFNSPETYTIISFRLNGVDSIHDYFWLSDIPLVRPQLWDAEKVISFLDDVIEEEEGGKFSLLRKAYTISSHQGGVPTHHDIVRSLVPLATSLISKSPILPRTGRTLFDSVVNPQTPEEAFLALKSIYGLGDFLAYEVLCDLNYSNMWPFDAEQSFVNVGPGAERGLKRLGLPPTVDSVLRIHTVINKYLASHDFPFFRSRLISLRGIEHSLCEYDKYRRMIEYKNGASQRRAVLRLFHKSSDELYLKLLYSDAMTTLFKSWLERDRSGFMAEQKVC
jgi:hypothetical protein